MPNYTNGRTPGAASSREAPTQSPVNIDQNRAVGQDSPLEGSGAGREANKKHGYPGSPDIGTNAAQTIETGGKVPPSND